MGDALRLNVRHVYVATNDYPTECVLCGQPESYRMHVEPSAQPPHDPWGRGEGL